MSRYTLENGAVRDTEQDEAFSFADAVECLNRQNRIIDRLHERIARLMAESANAEVSGRAETEGGAK